MECTVPVQVRLATEHADVGSLERTVSAALAEVGATLWRALVAQLEASLPAPDTCPACSGPVKANGRAPRRLVTLAGEVELRRRRYRCTGCGTESVPLDLALGLEPRVQHTLGVRERALWLVTEMSYAKGRDGAELRRWRSGAASSTAGWPRRGRRSRRRGRPRPRRSWAPVPTGGLGPSAAARCGSAPTGPWSTTGRPGPSSRSRSASCSTACAGRGGTAAR
jgi:hypothetical protein